MKKYDQKLQEFEVFRKNIISNVNLLNPDAQSHFHMLICLVWHEDEH